MTHPPVAPRQQRPTVRRRPGILPGRRFAVCATCAAAVLAAAPAALADQTVVAATVYPGGAGAAVARAVSLTTLDGCPPYGGATSLGLYPSGQSFTVPGGTTWTMSTVLSCGLRIPAQNVTDVQVRRSSGYEQPLSGADLIDAGLYHDPSAPGALPVVSNNGGAVQNTYTRPWRGGGDDNGADQVTENGPIAIVVYENGSPLIVHATQRPVRRSASSETVALGATVHRADQTPVAVGGLTWSWSFSDGTSSRSPTPTHAFGAGTSVVTLQVSDPATGTGGTATFTVSYKPTVKHSTQPRPGGGNPPTGGPSGPRHGSPHPTSAGHGAPPGGSGTGTSQTQTHTQTQTQTHTPTQTQTHTQTQTQTTPTTASTPPAAAATPTPTTSTPAAPPPTTTTTPHRRTHRTRRRHRDPPAPAPGAHPVTGRLIGDVSPVPAASSPLAHATPAAATGAIAAARPATTSPTTPTGAILGVAAALALLGLGAARELRGHHSAGPRTPPPA